MSDDTETPPQAAAGDALPYEYIAFAYLEASGSRGEYRALFVKLTDEQALKGAPIPVKITDDFSVRLSYDEKIIRAIGHARPGEIFRVQFKDNSVLYTKGQGGVGIIHDASLRERWQIRHREATREQRALAEMEKERSQDLLAERLAPLRHEYWRLAAPQRDLFIATIVATIVRGSPKQK